MEKERRNAINKFELEGNVANINDIYVNPRGKKSLRFDLGQNNNGNTQYVPIVIKGDLVDTYGNDILKGDWLTIKGRISTYVKEVERNGNTYKNKVIEILGFEITNKDTNKVYTSDGQVHDLGTEKEDLER